MLFRSGAFQIDEVSVGWGPVRRPYEKPEFLAELREKYGYHGFAFLNNNIVDCVKSGYLIGQHDMQAEGRGGTLRYYTFNISCHDDYKPAACGSRLRFAYQALYSPFIPMWFVGEEWNNPNNQLEWGDGVLFFNVIDWAAKETPENTTFFEDIKRHIAIRRSHSDLFEYFPDSTRDANIEKVRSEYDEWHNPLQAYMRFGDGKAIIIVPNGAEESKKIKIKPDYSLFGLKNSDIVITDLFSGTELYADSAENLKCFETDVAADDIGIYLIMPRG